MRNKLDACRIYPFDREGIAECPIRGQAASFPGRRHDFVRRILFLTLSVHRLRAARKPPSRNRMNIYAARPAKPRKRRSPLNSNRSKLRSTLNLLNAQLKMMQTLTAWHHLQRHFAQVVGSEEGVDIKQVNRSTG
jgi:hypothetical protein